jgi:ribosomal protein L16 Arg81 hydroxylase
VRDKAVKLTITFPDEIAKLVRRLPDPDKFVSQAVEKALNQEPIQSESTQAESSKWAKLAQRIERESTSLGDYYEQFKKDLAEFRRDFRFKHDET